MKSGMDPRNCQNSNVLNCIYFETFGNVIWLCELPEYEA